MSATICSEALRSIGQDLEARCIKTFVIRCEADFYAVEAGYQSPPAPTPLILHYTLDDLEQLDHEGREGRRKGDYDSSVKDFLRLSQILRAIGVYVSRKGSRLERVVDDRTGAAIYDMCVSMYKLRGRSGANDVSDAHWHAF
jgi:hypothetical protein